MAGDLAEHLVFTGGQFPEVELVPTWLANLNRMLPKGEIAPVPLIAKVTFGAPVALQENEDKQAFLARARHLLQALSHKEEA